VILVDSNVLIDVVADDPEWADWSLCQLRGQSQVHELAINPVVYAELSLTFSNYETVDTVVAQLELTLLELPGAALFLAGKAFLNYRRRGGKKSGVLSDFFVGAHAAVASLGLLTRDVQRYRTYFPKLELISP
jgi:predicted nucleic acid-binding protein